MISDVNAIAEALPNYEVGQELGRGGFGVVYAGVHRHLGRPVAIKQLPKAFALDSQVQARFVSEARVLASLEHPHIVPVYDYVEKEGLCLLVMESLGGGTVWQSFQSAGVSNEQACAIAMVTAAALQYAHAKGVLHRDVKPENLLFSSDHQLKLTDFGIAKVVGGVDAMATSAGDILGTPAYIAPEQAEGAAELGPPADVYAAGVMLYELLSGRLPFSEEGGGLAIVYRHVYEEPEPLAQVSPQVPVPLSDVVMKALARSPGDRYDSAEDFGIAVGEAALESFGEGWLSQTGLPVLGAGRMQTSLEAAARPPSSGSNALPVPAGERAPVTYVRPSISVHVGGVVPSSELEEPLVPVREVLDLPPPPRPLTLAAVATGALLLLFAFLGLGSGGSSGTLPAAGTTVAGQDLATTSNVKMNVDQPIAVRVVAVPGASSTHMKLSVVGTEIADSHSAALSPQAGALAGSVNLTSAFSSPRYVVSGPVTATLYVDSATGAVLASRQFKASPTTSGIATVPAGVVLVLFLLVIAFLESLLRPLRRLGRVPVTRAVGIGVMGAIGGLAFVGLFWVLGVSEPSVATCVICAILGAACSVTSAFAIARYGQRARLRRVARKYGLVVVQRPQPVGAVS